MTWRSTTVEEERLLFIQEALDKHTNLTFQEICEKYNISRKTGYKWYKRFLLMGREALADKSRARLTQPEKVPENIESMIVAIRKEYPTWGPKKIKALMAYESVDSPSRSSIANILKKHELSKSRHYRRHVANTAPLADCHHPNDVWMYDFKGSFRLGDGSVCEPLTITDGSSRYLLSCVQMQRKRGKDVWEVLQRAFFEYGLPLRIRSDNGPPFATTGVGRLSQLAVNIIKAGVTPEWISPGCPQENGRHERFHLTLKNETASPPASSLSLQVEKFKQFTNYYNNIRPHEALGFVTPKERYCPSPRRWDGVLRSPDYGMEYDKRKVCKGGNISWKGEVFFISESLRGEYVGLKELALGEMGVYFGSILLGIFDFKKGFKRS